MGGSKTAGFTKTAQKQKFVRNRDIQLKGSEIRKEEKIQRLMCEGICPKCREKVQWRFKYDKYKPLKNPCTCQDCHNKTVTKAYRTLCDACATSRKICASCCGELFPSVPSSAMPSENLEHLAEEIGNDSIIAGTEASIDEIITNDDHNMPPEKVIQSVQSGIPSEDWDARAFHHLATSKYSKKRIVGSEQDRIFAFGVSGGVRAEESCESAGGVSAALGVPIEEAVVFQDSDV